MGLTRSPGLVNPSTAFDGGFGLLLLVEGDSARLRDGGLFMSIVFHRSSMRWCWTLLPWVLMNASGCGSDDKEAPKSDCGTCESGWECHEGKCTQACDATEECRDGKACLDGFCSSCTHDDDCDGAAPAECVDGDTLRVYALPGTCAGGVCSYGYADRGCLECGGRCDQKCTGVEDCDQTNPCVIPTCADDGYCAFSWASESTACDDEVSCTSGEHCDGAGKCMGGENICHVDLEAIADVWIEDTENKNGQDFLIVGKTSTYPLKRALVAFDLSSLDVTSIVKAELHLHYYFSEYAGVNPETPLDRTIGLHRMLRAWSETEATATMSMAGTSWTSPYVGIDDVDAVATPDAELLWVHEDYGDKGFDITDAVNGWLANPSSNFGLLLRADNEESSGWQMRIHSREHTDSVLRPTLVVDWE